MRSFWWICVLGAFLALAPAPASGRAVPSRLAAASAFAAHIVRLIGENRYAEAWNSLHPLHQQAAPLERYVACENLTPIPGRIASIRTLRVWDTPVRVAGLPERVRGAKVKLRIVVSDPSALERTAVVKTVGVVRVAGRWAWLLPPSRYDAYAAGECPG